MKKINRETVVNKFHNNCSNVLTARRVLNVARQIRIKNTK